MICKIISPILLLSTVLALGCTDGHSQENSVNHFKVSVQNATAGNLLSPYLVIVHKADSSLINIAAVSSAGLQQLAETGATDIYQAELAANTNVISVSKVAGMPLIAGEARDVLVDAPQDVVDSGALVTVVAMIGKSNDSFIAARNVPLSSFTGKGLLVDAKNFDAGTEENTGNVEDLNATSHPVAVVEGKISYDRGLNPNGNAPEILRWGASAADVTFFKL
jgi:hypothetical protein